MKRSGIAAFNGSLYINIKQWGAVELGPDSSGSTERNQPKSHSRPQVKHIKSNIIRSESSITKE